MHRFPKLFHVVKRSDENAFVTSAVIGDQWASSATFREGAQQLHLSKQAGRHAGRLEATWFSLSKACAQI
jgi:hypothetical protein